MDKLTSHESQQLTVNPTGHGNMKVEVSGTMLEPLKATYDKFHCSPFPQGNIYNRNTCFETAISLL
jgi:hypothetical protein